MKAEGAISNESCEAILIYCKVFIGQAEKDFSFLYLTSCIYWLYYLDMFGAGNGIRTRDPKLGKLVLYQLSYARSEIKIDYSWLFCQYKKMRGSS
jgi:hypothetical protein